MPLSSKGYCSAVQIPTPAVQQLPAAETDPRVQNEESLFQQNQMCFNFFKSNKKTPDS